MKKFFKTKRFLSLIMALVMLILGAISAYATSIEELEERQKELEEQNEQYQQQLDESREKVDEQQDYVDALVGKIQTVNEQIAVSRQKIAALDADIKEKQRQIDEKNKEIEDSLEALRSRLRTIYMSGDVSTLEIILGAKDFSDFLDKIQLIQYVSRHDEQLIDSIQAQKDAIADEKKALQADKKAQEEEQAKLEQKQEELNILLEENKEILANLQAASDEAEMRLELSQEEYAQLSDEIRELKEEEERRRKEEEERRRQEEEERRKQQEEQGNTGSSGDDTPSYTPTTPDIPSDGGWVWPTPGFYYLSSVFHEERSYEYHGGVDIAGADIMNTPIFAAHSGTVISTCYSCDHNWPKYYSCGCGGGYGNYVWIAHGDGKETIYGHMTTPVVNTGDYVYAGQLIGYVGTTGHSTGPHLHFEARYYGERYDPMSEY